MNKKIIFSILMLTCLAFMPISASADYPTGTLGYSDDIIPGAEFEWTVDTLTFTGEFTEYSTDAYIGTEYLSQGDKIKVVVTEDPDTAVGDWLNLFVGGAQVDVDFGFLVGYAMIFTFGGFFINPITYTNATGTYPIYEAIMDEIGDYYYDESTETAYTYSGTTYEYGYTIQMSFSLEGDVFSYYMYEHVYANMEGGGYDESLSMETRIQSSTSISTGLLGTMEFYVDYNVPSYAGSMHIVIDSDYAPIEGSGKTVPFAWGFSLLGVSTLAVLVVLIKRKRN